MALLPLRANTFQILLSLPPCPKPKLGGHHHSHTVLRGRLCSAGEHGAGGRGGGVPWQQAEDKASVRARGRGRGQRVRVGEHWQHSLRAAAGGGLAAAGTQAGGGRVGELPPVSRSPG